MGAKALGSNTTGNYNSAMGMYALRSNTEGDYNSAMGVAALYNNTTGNYNSAMGAYALRNNTTGNYNSAIGAEALWSNTTGNYNTAVGYQAGFSNQTGSSNVFLGYRAGYNETGSNKLYIENSDSSNPLIYGEFDNDIVKINGKLGVGMTPGSYRLTLPNTANALGRGVANAWHTYSSIRWKKNMKPIEDALNKVNKLRGVYFDWKKNDKHDIGMIAEEVGAVIPEVVSYEEDGKYAIGLDYARLVPLLIEAIKAQQQQIDQLKEQLKQLKK
jgi:hypothetical protein